MTLFDDAHAWARTERDLALFDVEHSAPAGWAETGWAWLTEFLRTHAEFFPDQDLRAGPEPPERRAWGVLVRRARTQGLIAPTGELRPRTSGHCAPGMVYRSLIAEPSLW